MAPSKEENDEKQRDMFRDELQRAFRSDDKLTDEERKKIRAILDNFDAIIKIVESRKVTLGVYQFIGEISKWLIAVFGAIAAWKIFFSGGGPPK